MDGEAPFREVPSARADAARPRASGRRQSGARTASATAHESHKPWLARLVRLASIALVLVGLVGIGIAASKPGAGSSPRALLSALLEPSTPDSSGTPATASTTPTPTPTPSSGGEGWLAPPRAASRVSAPAARAADASAPPPAPAAASAAPPAPCPPLTKAGPAAAGAVVVLNRADSSELMRLPGIGRRRAEAIIQLRERLGGFKRASDLLRVRGIGTRSLERLLPLIAVDEPAEPRGNNETGAPSVGARAAVASPPNP